MGSGRGPVGHPFDGLIALAERERDVIASGDYQALEEIVEARSALLVELPDTPPEGAQEAMTSLLELQQQIHGMLEAASSGVAAELERLRRGRADVRRYGGQSPAAPSRLNLSA